MVEQIEHPWHSLTAEEAFRRLDTGLSGLSAEEARSRLARFGPNALQEREKPSPVWLFLEQFKNVLIIILLFATVLSAILGDMMEAGLIFVIVLFAAGLGFIQEYRAERAMEALARMAAPTATVVRGGEEQPVDSRELVPGDIVVLHSGDRIAADARLVEAVSLRTDEASLTGESLPVDKTDQPVPGEDIPVGDRKNMVFMGTSAVYGRARAVVVATGMFTQFGRIAGMLQEVESRQTPLQVSLNRLGKWISLVALAIVAVVFLMGVSRGQDLLDMFIWAVSLAVAAVPEALPAVVTITLAIGVQRMVKRHALIRKLPAVETLGSTTFILSDKTGTLTQDQMTVRKIFVNRQMVEVSGSGYQPEGEFFVAGLPFPAEEEHLQALLRIAALCNDSRLVYADGGWEVRGDPTEGALMVAAAKAGLDAGELARQLPRLGEVPFSPERKRMTTLHPDARGRIAFSKGAPEVIIASCSHIMRDGVEKPLSPQEREAVLMVNQQMAGEALRVLALAYKPGVGSEVGEEMERDMVLMGLVGMMDPPRPESREAVARCREAGIKSVMITGDHKQTAVTIARELGMVESGLALSGVELDGLSDEQLEAEVERVEVYARVSPAHKFRVVEALANKGHIVAMTGDGVNDAPALKKASIGVAMGITGTDVAKEAADMILTDDNFASIVAAVEEGRGSYSNIRKFLMYMFATNLGELMLVLGAVLLGFPLPLTAIQLLFINLVTDGLPALALAVDPAEPDIMRRPPRRSGAFIFNPADLALIALGGFWLALVSLNLLSWATNTGKSLVQVQALVFLTVIFFEYFKAFVFRSPRYSLLHIGPFSNRWLVRAVLLNILLLLPVVYLTALQAPFHTFSLGLRDWALVLVLAFSAVPVLEMGKLLLRRLGW